MQFYYWILIAILAFVLFVYLPMFLITKKIARGQYEDKLTRSNPSKWGRENSCPENTEHSFMYDEGMCWAEKHKDKMTDVEIKSCGLSLKGKYCDLGYDTCVIIVPGRAESLNYSYYFAEPYEKADCNLLFIDTRAHGLSEGKYVGMGIGEIPDLIEWIKLIKTEYHIDKIFIHGICIGSSTAVMASVKEECPEISGIIAEGMFKSFYTIFSQRTRNSGHTTFMFMDHIYRLGKKYAGVDIKRQSPEAIIDKVDVPMLFFHSLMDDASLPKYARELFDKCASKNKKLVWFDKGAHSHIRVVNKEKYDYEIKLFIAENR